MKNRFYLMSNYPTFYKLKSHASEVSPSLENELKLK